MNIQDLIDNMDDEEGFEELTEQEDLMETVDVGFRMFILRDLGRTQLLGIAYGESSDSILIYFPSVYRLDPEEGFIELESFIQSVPFVRIFKSDIAMAYLMPEQFQKVYKSFIHEKLRKVFPEAWSHLREQMDIDIPTKRAIIDEPAGGLEAYLEEAGNQFRTPPGSSNVQ